MTKVDVYWHRPKCLWSIRADGRVVDHLPRLALADCRMVVRATERERYVRTRKRTVHAWVTGTLITPPEVTSLGYEYTLVGYSPLYAPTFTIRPGYRPIFAADVVAFTAGGQLWALVDYEGRPENSA